MVGAVLLHRGPGTSEAEGVTGGSGFEVNPSLAAIEKRGRIEGGGKTADKWLGLEAIRGRPNSAGKRGGRAVSNRDIVGVEFRKIGVTSIRPCPGVWGH